MLKVIVAHSEDPDSAFAIAEILQVCLKDLQGQVPQAALLFAAIDFDHGLILQRIYETFPELELIGGTTDGEISSVSGFQQDSLVLMLFCSDEIEIRAGLGQRASVNPAIASQQAVTQAIAKSTLAPRFCITIPESLTANGIAILDGLNQALGSQIPVFGGLAADQWRFQQTYQFYQSKVYSDAVPVLLFCGPVLFSHGVASGWQPIGKPSQVTQVEKNVLYKVGDKTALEFYQYYLGQLPPSSEYPLAVFAANTDQFYMRAPSVYDSTTGSITFFADIPEGAIVQITETSHDNILAASKASMEMALANYPGQQPAVSLFFSCASRRQILGTRTREEYQIVQGCLPESLPGCGFYSNGEIAPLNQMGRSHFHNETFITLLLGTR